MNSNHLAHWLKLAYETAFKQAIVCNVEAHKQQVLRSAAWNAGEVELSDEPLLIAYEKSKDALAQELRRTALLRHECVSRGIEVRE